MFYIGIDPSLNASGIVCINENNDIIDYLTFTTKKKTNSKKCISLFELNKGDYFNKIIYVTEKIYEFITRYNNITICIESFSYGSNSRSVTVLAELQGVLKFRLLQNNYQYHSIAPSQVKKFITGKGNANKEIVKKSCLDINKQLLNLSIQTYDIFDAYALAYYGLKNF